MSFLDDQATGQIGIGEKANLSTLTRRKRKRKKGQAPTGSETYSLMPQNEFSNIVSSPTDIQQVGIGNLLQAQGDSAGKVPNVFEEYDSAAPLLGTKEAVYYQPPPDEEEEEEEEDLPSVEDDPMRDFSPDTGIDEKGNPNYQDPFATDAEGNPMAPGATGLTFAQDMANLKISAQKFFPFGKTGYETQDPETGGSGRMAPLPKGALEAYGNYGDAPEGGTTGASGQGTGGRGGPTLSGLTPDALDALGLTGEIDPGVSGVGDSGGDGGDGGGGDAPGEPDAPGGAGGWNLASGGTVKAKNKNSFMSMKGK